MRRSEFDFNMLRSIEVFMTVAELKQVTAAAEALGMTQSAASQHLKNLETAFGTALFDRANRPLDLTHAGEVLRRRGFRILNEVQDLRSELSRLGSSPLPILRLALLASIATVLTPALKEFATDRLNVPELSLSAGLASDHHQALSGRRIDIAVTSEPLFDMAGFESHIILKEPFFLVLPGVYDKPVSTIAELSNSLPLIRFSAHTPVGRKTDQHLQRLRLDLPRALDADRASMVVAGVASGRGFAILTPSLLVDAVAEGMNLRIEALPFAGFSRTLMVVARQGDLGQIPTQVADICRYVLCETFAKFFPELQLPAHSATDPPL